MSDYGRILANVVPLFLVMGLGAWIRRRGILNEVADRTLVGLGVHLLQPCLILDRVMANPELRDLRNLLWSPLLGFISAAVGVRLAYFIAQRIGLRSDAANRTFGFTAGIFNYGYVAIPLVDALYSSAVGILFLFNLGVETAFWIVGFSLLEGRSLLSEWRKVLTSPVQAILLAVAINLITAHFGTSFDIPTLDAAPWGAPLAVLARMIHLVGLCSIPLALLLTGATMSDFWATYIARRDLKVTLNGIVVRNLLCPLFMISLAALLPIPVELKEVLVVQAAMPAGVFPLLLARHHGGDVMVALQIIFGTSALSLITMPLWIHLGTQICFPNH